MLPQVLHSIQDISFQYDTGELPVLVLCSDTEQYICKYMRPTTTIAYKLASEFIGATLASLWRINTPPFAIINIRANHWNGITTPHSVVAPTIGFRRLNDVIDIIPITYRQVKSSFDTLYQLLKIALFDFWVANEDRTYNNANLLYNVASNQLISIDYGGIFNNNISSDYPLSQLTENDSILCADVFKQISLSISNKQINRAVYLLKADFGNIIIRCRNSMKTINNLPKEWAIPSDKITNKLNILLSSDWIAATWNNFIECLISNSNYEK